MHRARGIHARERELERHAKGPAEPDDRLLVHGFEWTHDVDRVIQPERERLAHYLETWQAEKARLAVLPTRQGKQLRLRWTGYPVHIDDEFWRGEEQEARDGSSTIEISVDGTVEFLVPAESNVNVNGK